MHISKMIGAAAVTFLLLGAGCAKTTAPEQETQPDTAVEQENTNSETGTAGAQEETGATAQPQSAAPPKAQAGQQEAAPAVSSNLPPAQESATEPSSPSAVRESPPKASVREFTVTATQWSFSPGTITVNEGDTVRLVITSTDVTHGLFISAFNVNQTLQPNETKTVEFIANKKGTFPMVCSVYCGAGHPDMRGQLIVQ